MDSLADIKRFLDNVDEKDVHFKPLFHASVAGRPLSEELVRAFIRKTDKLEFFLAQKARRFGEDKYKLWFKMRRRYELVVVAVFSGKNLYIVNAWIEDRRW
jgi:hypothetical protein